MKYVTMLAAVAMAFAAAAQEMPQRPRVGLQGAIDPVMRVAMNPRLAEKIGVTEEQSAKIKALMNDREQVKKLNDQARAATQRQAELLKAEKIDEAAVEKALDEAWEARKQVAKLQTKRIIALKSILTPEQVAKAAEAMKEMRAQRGEGRKPRAEGRKIRGKNPKDAE